MRVPRTPMERAGRLIPKLQTARRHFSPDELVLAAWPAAVGRRLAARTRAVALRDGRLFVDVEDELWRRNLTALRLQILHNFSDLVASAAPTEIEFRVGIPRRPPGREESSPVFTLTAPRAADEADSIADPGLRRIYINSRRKALAS